MPGSKWNFSDDIPENYQRFLVPVLFAPFADDLVERVVDRVCDATLELACGTGVVSRRLRAALPESAWLTATDLSPALLALAQQSVVALERLDWRVADVMHLPFATGQFDAVVCQFGFMFATEPVQALREAHRVLRAGGRLVFNVWNAERFNPHALALKEAAQRFVPDADWLSDFARPYALSEPNHLLALLARSGFSGASIDVVAREAVSPSALDWARGAIFGSPRGAQFEALGIEVNEVVAFLAELLETRGGRAPCVLPL